MNSRSDYDHFLSRFADNSWLSPPPNNFSPNSGANNRDLPFQFGFRRPASRIPVDLSRLIEIPRNDRDLARHLEIPKNLGLSQRQLSFSFTSENNEIPLWNYDGFRQPSRSRTPQEITNFIRHRDQDQLPTHHANPLYNFPNDWKQNGNNVDLAGGILVTPQSIFCGSPSPLLDQSALRQQLDFPVATNKVNGVSTNRTMNNDQYLLKEQIGKGAFGTVYKAIDRLVRPQQRTVAIKIVTVSQKIDLAKHEIDTLKTLDHPNIVSYYFSFSFKQHYESDGIAIVMQYCSNGSLMKKLSVHSGIRLYFSFGRRIAWYKQLASGLQYIHKKGIAHRDIKPENILLDEDDCIKIADVGIAKAVSECCTPSQNSLSLGHFLTSVNGTRPYMAPEIFSGSFYGVPCDVFSLGLVFWMMNTLPPRCPEVLSKYGGQKYLGEFLVSKIYGRGVIDNIQPTSFLSTLFPIGTKFREIDLINKMLTKNPDTRISMLNVVELIKNLSQPKLIK